MPSSTARINRVWGRRNKDIEKKTVIMRIKSTPVPNIFLVKLFSVHVSLQTRSLEVTSKKHKRTISQSSDENRLLIITTPTFEN